MKFIKFKIAILIVVFSFCIVSIAMVSDYNELEYYAKIIEDSMPDSWRLIKKITGVIPYGHYDGLEYDGSKGILLLLEGDIDVFFHWKDKNEVWHREALAKESLEIWIMPPEYRLSWKRFFVMKSPVPAKEVYSDEKIRVYGYTSHHIESLKEFNEIASSFPSITTGWPDSPYHTGVLSWVTWKEDINLIMREALPPTSTTP